MVPFHLSRFGILFLVGLCACPLVALGLGLGAKPPAAQHQLQLPEITPSVDALPAGTPLRALARGQQPPGNTPSSAAVGSQSNAVVAHPGVSTKAKATSPWGTPASHKSPETNLADITTSAPALAPVPAAASAGETGVTVDGRPVLNSAVDGQEVTVSLACFKQCNLYVNGERQLAPGEEEQEAEAGEEGGEEVEAWKQSRNYQFTAKVGDVIGIEGFSHSANGAVAATVTCGDIQTNTGPKWKATNAISFKNDDWSSPAYEDMAWESPKGIGPYGEGTPKYAMITGIQVQNDDNPLWIWTRSTFDHNTFFRLKAFATMCPMGPGGFTGKGTAKAAHVGWDQDDTYLKNAVNLFGGLAQGARTVPVTAQSSTYQTAVASRAIDGNLDGNGPNGSVTQTNYGDAQWWQARLESPDYIEAIKIYRRTDCCKSDLTHFYVMVSMYPFPLQGTATDVVDLSTVWSVYVEKWPDEEKDEMAIKIHREAQYVRVMLAGPGSLMLAEVQAFGVVCDLEDCKNGGTVDKAECRCKCLPPWEGSLCGICKIPCFNGGTVDENTCKCLDCPSPWSGESCEACPLDKCENGGALDFLTCTCVCPEGTTGTKCTACTKTCSHGGTLKSTGTECDCECAAPWQGDRCTDPVEVDCKNSGTFHKDSATCTCQDPWTGPECSECPVLCKDGGTLNEEECTCECPEGVNVCEDLTCTLSCTHGGTLDKNKCECTCQFQWTGQTCASCDINCANGMAVDQDACTCECASPWTGPACTTCFADAAYISQAGGGDNDDGVCMHGGIAPTGDQCGCSCASPWNGAFCEECASSVCENGGVMNRATCTCDCAGLWAGDLCETCGGAVNSCKAPNGQFHAASCSCTCNNMWKGTMCETCPEEGCVNGGLLNKENCKCQCPQQWKGIKCQVCDARCEHGGHKDTAANTCACTNCNGLWAGHSCERCEVECQNGGILDKSLCVCTCPEGGGWEGYDCSTCNKWCANGASTDSACNCVCPDPWRGKSCEECGLNCVHGNPDTEKCTCICKNGYAGPNCEEKSCEEKDCGGGTWDGDACACTCKGNWEGEQCNDCNAICYHGGRKNAELCECDCEHGWGGNSCNECSIDECANRSEFDEIACKCTCESGYVGVKCDKCATECFPGHGTQIPENCLCSCNQQWGGPLCEKCEITKEHCENDGTPNDETCACDCPRGFEGEFCEECVFECQNGGVRPLDQEECNCVCPVPFTGNDCSEVIRIKASDVEKNSTTINSTPHTTEVYDAADFKKPPAQPVCGVLYACGTGELTTGETPGDDGKEWKHGKNPRIIFRVGTKRPDHGDGISTASSITGSLNVGNGGHPLKEADRAASTTGHEVHPVRPQDTSLGHERFPVPKMRGSLLQVAEGVRSSNPYLTDPLATTSLIEVVEKEDGWLDGGSVGDATRELLGAMESMNPGLQVGATEHKCKEVHTGSNKCHQVPAAVAKNPGKPVKMSARCFSLCHTPCKANKAGEGDCLYGCMGACMKAGDAA